MWPNPRIPFELSSQRPRLPPLDGKPLIVNIVVNIEHWPFDRPMPRGILPAPHGAKVDPPDVPNYSWVEYGMRCGIPRLFDMLATRGLKASAFMNAEVADVYPSLAKAVIEAGWELVGHGWFQRSLKQSEDEAAEIRRCLDRLQALDGKRVRGWFGAGGGETNDTPEHLKAAGLDFIHDWLVDDLPVWMTTRHGPLLCLPYTWELNDVPAWVVHSHSSDELLLRLDATLAVLEREIVRNPRIITFGLHPHIVGVPHRAYHLEKAFDLLLRRPDTVFVTSSQIADWYTAADPDAPARLAAAMAARTAR
ncbi:MAG: polysaccharide deacetylase family protein [Hyphomicrobiaceae bacterium]|nr:polysaccharide deacetylase family protein [Hyphomicrobiaceae bacterium]